MMREMQNFFVSAMCNRPPIFELFEKRKNEKTKEINFTIDVFINNYISTILFDYAE